MMVIMKDISQNNSANLSFFSKRCASSLTSSFGFPKAEYRLSITVKYVRTSILVYAWMSDFEKKFSKTHKYHIKGDYFTLSYVYGIILPLPSIAASMRSLFSFLTN